MHNILHINSILYNVSTATCFDASASYSASLILVTAEVTKLIKLLKLQFNEIISILIIIIIIIINY